MKKIFTIILSASMVLGLCSCASEPDTSSKDEVIVEEVIVDQTGSQEGSKIESNQDATSSENTSSTQNTSSTPTTSNNSSGNTSTIESPIKKYQNMFVEVDLCDDIIRGYLDADSTRQQYYWLSEYSGTNYDHQAIYLDWYSDGSMEYTVHFSEKSDFSNEIITKTKYNNMENTILVPGKTYYYKVTGTINSEILGSGQIKVKDAPVRWIDIDGVGNVRDMGGWKAAGGKTVKYGMLYRGRRLEDVTADGIATIKQLGLKTELDIRYASQMYQTPGTGMNYQFIESPGQYDNVMTTNGDVFKASYRKLFELLADKNNYPF